MKKDRNIDHPYPEFGGKIFYYWHPPSDSIWCSNISDEHDIKNSDGEVEPISREIALELANGEDIPFYEYM